MNKVLKELAPVDRYKTYQILNQVMDSSSEIQIKIINDNKILNLKLKRIGQRKHFYLNSISERFENKPEVTFKIIINNKLYFLKTIIKKIEGKFYFDNYDNFFELIRRKKPRFRLPSNWFQSVFIQSEGLANEFKSAANIVEMSKEGMQLKITPEIPRYEKNQSINLKFKVFRRAEIQVNAKIIHVKKHTSGGPTIGVQFIDETILIKNKIQNVCDDLAFFYAAENEP